LKELSELYIDTLNKISSDQSDQSQGYIGARYKPATYVKEREKFLDRFGEAFDDGDLKVAQTNLSEFMRKLLVMRFESSKYAFRTTLERMIANNKLIINWWSQMGIVPIMKKGNLPDPDDFALDDGMGLDDFESKLEKLRESKGLLEVPAEWIDEKFILDVTSDTKLLEEIHHSWFKDADLALMDPKLDELEMQIKKLLVENPSRKIVVFSSYADTVNSIANGLSDRGMSGVLAFTAADSSRDSRKILLSNFDASYTLGPQQDEYQVLICTDALSEGVNLHRAGVIFNYDIPYNPTRVVQRIGRINRINKKVFDVIHIYNFFPTVIGNSIISTKAIATLKKALINSIMGDDVRALTPDENLETFFMEEFVQADEGEEDLSWDAAFIEEYENAVKAPSLLQKIEQIPRRSRISRASQQSNLGLVFSKHGQSSIFISAHPDADPEVLSTEEALKLFKAHPDEQGSEVSQKFSPLFKMVRDKLDAKHELPVIKGRRNDALNLLEALRLQLPAASSYCVDLIRIIKDLDDIDEGTLKDLAQIREKTPEKIFELVKSAVPESHVRNILARVQRMEDEAQTILLAEEFQK
jgi:hypothetical protein